MKEWIVETKALTKKFHNFTAVDQVSFHMKKGSITGLIGPNGAGKSTLMKLMSGLLHETQGELKLFGKHPGEGPVCIPACRDADRTCGTVSGVECV